MIEDFLIVEGLKPHDRLPSERELCNRWKLNRVTLIKAIKHLINEGVLYSKKGSGTFVAPDKIERNLWEFSSFTNAIRKSQANLKTKSLSIKLVEADKNVAKILKILLGTSVYKIERLRIVNNAPLALEHAYIPQIFCNGIENEDLEKNSLYAILKEKYKIKLIRSTQNIELRTLDDPIASLLDLKEGEAALVLSGTAYDTENTPVEYAESITRGDRCVFSSNLRWSK